MLLNPPIRPKSTPPSINIEGGFLAINCIIVTILPPRIIGAQNLKMCWRGGCKMSALYITLPKKRGARDLNSGRSLPKAEAYQASRAPHLSNY